MVVKKKSARKKTAAHDERHMEIIRECASLFDKVGYHRASMQMLADEVGLGKPTLYHYFASKADILYEMHQLHIDALTNGLKAEIVGITDPGEMLKRACVGILRQIAEHPGYVRAFMDHYAELEGKKRAEIRKRRQEYFDMIVGIIKQGIAAKKFRQSSPEDTALAFLGMCNWAYKWYPAMAASRTPEQVAQALCGLFFDGLKLPK